MSSHRQTADAAAIRLLRSQHGYGRVGQLYALGLSRTQVAQRVARGILERVAHGVVTLTPPERSEPSLAMRAVMLAGEGTVAGLWTAASLHRLHAPRSREVHVMREGPRRPRSTDDVHLHRTRWLPPEHVTTVGVVPVTALPRTLVDCSRLLDHWSALEMLDSASVSAAMWSDIHATATLMSNGRAGVRAIAIATSPEGAQRLRSTLERRALDALTAHGVPGGVWNVVISDRDGRIREVDLCFREQRLIIEFDGLAHHQRTDRAVRDRRSDRRLQLAGWRVLRFSWTDVVHNPARTAREVIQALRS